ncbi:hypothetical protein [Shinella zoogloeoides]
MDDMRVMIAEGDILGFKRTSTFARFGFYSHSDASYDVFVDASLALENEEALCARVADYLGTDKIYIRIVREQMCEFDYPTHIEDGREA